MESGLLGFWTSVLMDRVRTVCIVIKKKKKVIFNIYSNLTKLHFQLIMSISCPSLSSSLCPPQKGTMLLEIQRKELQIL